MNNYLGISKDIQLLLQKVKTHPLIIFSFLLGALAIAVTVSGWLEFTNTGQVNIKRLLTVNSILLNFLGACWIAAGVVLRSADLIALDRASTSGMAGRYIGRDPNKEIIPNMLKIASRRAAWGVFFIFLGGCLQLVSEYFG